MQVNKHVHAIKIPFSVTLPNGLRAERFVYVYLIYGTNGITMIDTGVAGSEGIIFDYIRKTERRAEDIFLIIQTHSHPDHIGSTRTIKAETGCAVAAHSEEKGWIEDVGLQAAERPVPGFESLVAGSVKVDRILEDREVFDLGCGLKLQVFHTPGHSKGSIAILLLGYMALFTGDAIPVPGEMPIYEDVIASIESIKTLKRITGLRYLLPSWDEARTGEEAYRRMDEGLKYIGRIHDAVLGNSEEGGLRSCEGEFAGRVLASLGIPPEQANPLVARSLSSHLRLSNRKIVV